LDYVIEVDVKERANLKIAQLGAFFYLQKHPFPEKERGEFGVARAYLR